jgi:pSer/pThr/pTyr-binding forkhead associated (FHA) protein
MQGLPLYERRHPSADSVVRMFDTTMPFIILGQQRFALPIGETRIGGAGAGALPFSQLARHETVAVLLLTPDDIARLRPQGDGSVPLTVDGVPVGTEPVTLTHGAKIEVAGLRLIFGHLREIGATVQLTGGASDRLAFPILSGEGEPTADSGGRLTARGSGSVVTIPDAGLTVGRDPESGLVIRGKHVSRRHAVIRASIQGYVVRDLSTNGTYVNGRRVDGSQVLGMGDVIRIGDEEFRFEADPATYEPSAELRGREPARPLETPAYALSLEPPTAPRADSARLLATLEIISKGVLKGTQFRVERPVVHLGRAPRNDIRLSDRSVSDSHATLTHRRGAWVVRDRGSTNGTYVNGHRVAGERALPDNCALRTGDVIMRFRIVSGALAPSNDRGGARGLFGRLAKLWQR